MESPCERRQKVEELKRLWSELWEIAKRTGDKEERGELFFYMWHVQSLINKLEGR